MDQQLQRFPSFRSFNCLASHTHTKLVTKIVDRAVLDSEQSFNELVDLGGAILVVFEVELVSERLGDGGCESELFVRQGPALMQFEAFHFFFDFLVE